MGETRESGAEDWDAFSAQFGEVETRLLAFWILTVRTYERMRRHYDAEDLFQETLIRARRAYPCFDHHGSFTAWVLTIARNLRLDILKHLAVAPEGQFERSSVLSAVPDHVTSITRRLARDEDLAELRAFAAELDEADRKIFIYKVIEGLSLPQIAELLGTTSSAVTMRWRRLRDRLRGHPRLRRLFPESFGDEDHHEPEP